MNNNVFKKFIMFYKQVKQDNPYRVKYWIANFWLLILIIFTAIRLIKICFHSH